MDVFTIEFIENSLKVFAHDTELDYDIRADAADVLLHYGRPHTHEDAIQVIEELGKSKGMVRNVYDHAQNVHNVSIEESAVAILEHLTSICTIDNSISFGEISSELRKIVKDKDEQAKHAEFKGKETLKILNSALIRIQFDRALYGKFNATLSSICVLMWNYIIKQEEELQYELKIRLLQELLEMSGKCSTGYAFRIVNTLSGYTEFGIKISFEEQICGNLSGRLNAKIREIISPEEKEMVLNEMTMLCSNEAISQRPNFLKFFRDNLGKIRNEIWETFRDDISDHEFDMFFRKAIARYEGHTEAYTTSF